MSAHSDAVTALEVLVAERRASVDALIADIRSHMVPGERYVCFAAIAGWVTRWWEVLLVEDMPLVSAPSSDDYPFAEMNGATARVLVALCFTHNAALHELRTVEQALMSIRGLKEGA